MKTFFSLAFTFTFLFTGNLSAQQARAFPQKEINNFSASAIQQMQNHSLPIQKNTGGVPVDNSVINMLHKLSKKNPAAVNFKNTTPVSPDTVSVGDTLIVGFTPNDTLRISGNWTHVGPVVVFGNGVLIFDNATTTLVGDIIVLGNGKVFSDSSYFFFPQQYWYQRSVIIVQNGYMNCSNTIFNYGGYPHGFSASDSAVVLLTNITNNDYTTTGLSKNASMTINGNNLTGEFIITDKSNLSLRKATNALLWHQFPDTAVINHSFPNGSTVNTYLFNKNTPGVSGIEYYVAVDTSYNIQWAMMPTNGSDITISNSTIRSIGLWFEGSDTSNVSGLVNNSNYSNFTAPLSDRNLQLNNTSLQTWSIYSFDSVFINISGCIVGEVGAFGHSKVNGTNYWVDGSGGYCFSSDTSSLFNGFCSVSSHVRSERNSIQMFAYSTQNNGMTSAIGSSVLIVVQSTLPQDPVPYEKSCVWMAIISQPSTAYVDSVVPVVGSAWIDKTNVSPWMDFGSSRVWYQKTGDTIWKTVNNAVVQEIRSSTLALWNTNGLTPGSYNLRLMLFDNWGDSVEAIKSVNLLPAILLSADEEPSSEIPISIYPNPASGEFDVQCLVFNVRNVELRIYDVFGKIIFQSNISSPTSHISCDLPDGIYFLQIQSKDFIQTKKITIIR